MSESEKKDKDNSKTSFWSTLPGVITAIAALVTAIATLVGAVNATGVFKQTASNDLTDKESLDESETTENNKEESQLASKIVGSDVVLVDSDGELDLPKVEEKVEVEYVCKEFSDGAFSTVVKTSKLELILINWTKQIGDAWSPSSRCNEVTERFKMFHNENSLDYLTTGRMNGQNVICVASSDGDCNRNLDENGLLFTITTDKMPGEVLLNLLDLGLAKDVPPINESTGDRVYIDINNLIAQSEKDSLNKGAADLDSEVSETSQLSDEDNCIFGCGN